MLKETPMPHLNYSVLAKLWALPEMKLGLGVLTAALSWLYDPVYVEALLALFLLILCDFITGVAASRREGVLIESAKLRRTAAKVAIYFAMIAAGHISEKALPLLLNVLDETITGYLVATELLSILENAGRLGFATPTELRRKLQEYTHRA